MATLAEILALLPDNNTGEINAADVRAAITALWHRTDGTDPIEGLLFDPAAAPGSSVEGRVQWNDTLATLNLNSGGDPVLQVGYETVFRGRNTSGSTLLNGTPVQIVGATGDRPQIVTDDGLGRIAGVVTADIPNNADGRVVVHGTVNDLDTSMFDEGDFLFADSGGGYTLDRTASFVGIVTRVNANVGAIFSRAASFREPFGTTADRPALTPVGYMYFDTTLGQPVWWNGAQWVDATGSAA